MVFFDFLNVSVGKLCRFERSFIEDWNKLRKIAKVLE